MHLDNQTPFDVKFQLAERSPRRDTKQSERRAEYCVGVVVKSTFEMGVEGAIGPPADEGMPIVTTYLETPFGDFHSELFFKKKGVDLCVLGNVK